ncbi:hypothetical protein [uncultured Agathobaculum sp.]|uniref:hypothetical protein n=1 Tax=uncultured Agathobaculum sp. TaxID=2048140 RepID=UPI00320A2270
MRNKLGRTLQVLSGLLTMLLAGASDMGQIGAYGLTAGLLGASLLFFAGRGLLRQRPFTPYHHRMTAVIPLPDDRRVPHGAQ